MRRPLRPMLASALAVALASAGILFVAPVSSGIAADDTCPTYDLNSIFAEEFYPGLRWDTRAGKRVMTWSWSAQQVNGVPVARPFDDVEKRNVLRSFEAWDMALDSLTFERIEDASKADIKIGLVPIQNSGYWTVERDGEFRTNGSIQISSTPAKPFTEAVFTTVVLSELGNLLGLGDIQGVPKFHSVMLDPDTEPFGVIPLVDEDIDMMRQFYGESTCRSSWSQQLKDAKEAAKATPTPTATPTTTPTPTVTVTSTPKPTATTPLKKTIICVKGKTVKLVKAIKPVCPKGYKKR